MWTLRSPGNGSIHFEQVVFRNFSSVNSLFDTPFKNFRNRTLKISSLAVSILIPRLVYFSCISAINIYIKIFEKSSVRLGNMKVYFLHYKIYVSL